MAQTQSCLEILSIEERHEEIIRNDYTREDPYSATHPDALATGDWQGKGTGAGGRQHSIPDCTSFMGTSTFAFDDFDTAPSSNAGNDTDNQKRNESFVRSLYTAENNYYDRQLDTSANVREGQYVVEQWSPKI